MKNTNVIDLVSYCDISSEEELKLRLIGCLLSKCSEELDSNEVKEVGFLIVQYLQKKMVIDHYFFGRTVPKKYFSEEQRKDAISQLKNSIECLKKGIK